MKALEKKLLKILDIKQLATNAGELDVDDAVDVIEDLEESDKELFF